MYVLAALLNRVLLDDPEISLGGSGSGKTTLLNAIAHRLSGLPLDDGDVIFSSESGGPSLSRAEVKKRIGFVRQQDYLVECLTGESGTCQARHYTDGFWQYARP